MHFLPSKFSTDPNVFLESAGAIIFHLSTGKICVLHHLNKNEYILAKGRRNCGETRHQAALREFTEETGFSCHLLPLNMLTRAPPQIETEQLDDSARFYRTNQPGSRASVDVSPKKYLLGLEE